MGHSPFDVIVIASLSLVSSFETRVSATRKTYSLHVRGGSQPPLIRYGGSSNHLYLSVSLPTDYRCGPTQCITDTDVVGTLVGTLSIAAAAGIRAPTILWRRLLD